MHGWLNCRFRPNSSTVPSANRRKISPSLLGPLSPSRVFLSHFCPIFAGYLNGVSESGGNSSSEARGANSFFTCSSGVADGDERDVASDRYRYSTYFVLWINLFKPRREPDARFIWFLSVASRLLFCVRC